MELRTRGAVYEGENYCSSLLTGPLMAGDNLFNCFPNSCIGECCTTTEMRCVVWP